MNVLDHGYVELLRVDGDDQFIAETARTSTQSSGDIKKDENLVRRLVRDRHTSPIEFVGLVVEIQMPIFIARQWMRHRTGPYNEFSLRYSEAVDLYYVPDLDRCQGQSTFNKQGSAEVLPKATALEIQSIIISQSDQAFLDYKRLLDLGLTRELARMVLPTNFYTKVRWRIDLHNLMHFMKLREDPHAQWEIQQYANALHSLAAEHFPVAMEAFENHVQNRVTLSPQAAAFIAERMPDSYELQDMCLPQSLHSELAEFMRRN